MYLSAILSYLYLTWVFPFYATSYFYSTSFQMKISHFLLRYIDLPVIVTGYSSDFNFKLKNIWASKTQCIAED